MLVNTLLHVSDRFPQLIELLGGQNLAAIVNSRVVPLERLGDVVVHAEIEIGHHDHGRLQPFGQVEGVGRHLETFFRRSGKQQRMFRIAVRSVSREQNIGLLRSRRHAGRRAGPLNVDQNGRDLGKIAETEEFVHQARRPGRWSR